MKRFRTVLGCLVMMAGIGVFMYPYLAEAYLDYQTAKFVKEFDETYKNEESDTSDSDGSEDSVGEESSVPESSTQTDLDVLYQQCLSYNISIYNNLQSNLRDAWDYEQSPIDIDMEAFGYIEIPAMDLILPLYLGASTENMAKGAAVLGQTSIPVGGENTNAVIAGHRGYRGAPYFREIEKLSIGDVVYITNPWETLTYVVTAIDIIAPSNSEAIKIQEGKDMITLLTCHPYRSHGKYRYVVYCERVEEDTDGLTENEVTESTDSNVPESGTNTITASDGTVYELSETDIEHEQLFRIVCAGLITLMILILIVNSIRNRERKK